MAIIFTCSNIVVLLILDSGGTGAVSVKEVNIAEGAWVIITYNTNISFKFLCEYNRT